MNLSTSFLGGDNAKDRKWPFLTNKFYLVSLLEKNWSILGQKKDPQTIFARVLINCFEYCFIVLEVAKYFIMLTMKNPNKDMIFIAPTFASHTSGWTEIYSVSIYRI